MIRPFIYHARVYVASHAVKCIAIQASCAMARICLFSEVSFHEDCDIFCATSILRLRRKDDASSLHDADIQALHHDTRSHNDCSASAECRSEW